MQILKILPLLCVMLWQTTLVRAQWTSINLGTDIDLFSIHFPSDKVGYIVGRENSIFKTTDGGESWNKLKWESSWAVFLTVHFINNDIGFVSGISGGKIWKTENGGASWTMHQLPTSNDLNDIKFVNDTVGFIVGYREIWKTIDQGKSWNSQVRNHDLLFPVFYSIEFVNTDTIYIAGVDGETGRILKTTDGGNKWTSTSFSRYMRFDVKFVNELIGYHVGSNSDIYKTTDGGANWLKIADTGIFNNRSLVFLSETEGFTVGNDGLILATLDGGQSWNIQESNTDQTLRSIFFVTANKGFVVGQGGTLLKYSEDAGGQNAPPVLEPFHSKNVNEGELLSFTASATDPDAGQTLSFTLINAPDGASINAATGVFNWTPTESQGPGTFTFSIKVTDNGSPALSDEKQISISVDEVNLAPVLATIENVSTTCGNSISFTATATDSDLPLNTLTYTLQGYIPAGANLNATSGAFSWLPSPEQMGTHHFTLRVTDNGAPQLYHERTFTLVLEDKVSPMALVRNLTVQLNDTGFAIITADQLDGGSTDNCGIASMSIDKTTFSCADIGANEVILTVRDATGNTSSAVATVTVENSVGAPTAFDTWPSSMVYNSTESFSINAVEGASGYTWTVPPGFEIVSGENTTNIHVRAQSGSATGTISVRALGACDEGAALVAAIAATKATATVAISDLNQEFSGEARAVTVSTDPLGLAVQLLYDGSTNVPSAEGEYSVSAAIIDDNYAGEANATLKISPVTSIYDTEVVNGVKLYPNPMTGIARVEVEKGGSAQIVVTEISGRIIHRATVQGSYELNFESQAAGMYYMRVQLQGKPAVTLKLIKQ